MLYENKEISPILEKEGLSAMMEEDVTSMKAEA